MIFEGQFNSTLKLLIPDRNKFNAIKRESFAIFKKLTSNGQQDHAYRTATTPDQHGGILCMSLVIEYP